MSLRCLYPLVATEFDPEIDGDVFEPFEEWEPEAEIGPESEPTESDWEYDDNVYAEDDEDDAWEDEDEDIDDAWEEVGDDDDDEDDDDDDWEDDEPTENDVESDAWEEGEFCDE